MTSEMLRPTVRPIATDMSWSAVWNPERYESAASFFCWFASVSSPPLESPEGTWKRMPIIWRDLNKQPYWKRWTNRAHHDDESVTAKETGVDVGHKADRERAMNISSDTDTSQGILYSPASRANVILVYKLETSEMVLDLANTCDGNGERLYYL